MVPTKDHLPFLMMRKFLIRFAFAQTCVVNIILIDIHCRKLQTGSKMNGNHNTTKTKPPAKILRN